MGPPLRLNLVPQLAASHLVEEFEGDRAAARRWINRVQINMFMALSEAGLDDDRRHEIPSAPADALPALVEALGGPVATQLWLQHMSDLLEATGSADQDET